MQRTFMHSTLQEVARSGVYTVPRTREGRMVTRSSLCSFASFQASFSASTCLAMSHDKNCTSSRGMTCTRIKMQALRKLPAGDWGTGVKV